MIENYEDLDVGERTVGLGDKNIRNLAEAMIFDALADGRLHINAYRTFDRKGFMSTGPINKIVNPSYQKDTFDNIVFEIYIQDTVASCSQMKDSAGEFYAEAVNYFDTVDAEKQQKIAAIEREIESLQTKLTKVKAGEL